MGMNYPRLYAAKAQRPTIAVSVMLLLFTVTSALSLTVSYFQSLIHRRAWPYKSVMPPADQWRKDFFLLVSEIDASHRSATNSTPSARFLADVISSIIGGPSSGYIGIVTMWWITLGVIVFFALRSHGRGNRPIGLVLVLLSYPVLLAIHTGSLQFMASILLLGPALFADSSQWNMFAVALGLVTSLSPSAMLFVLAPLAIIPIRSAISVALRTVSVAAASTIVPNAVLGATESVHRVWQQYACALGLHFNVTDCGVKAGGGHDQLKLVTSALHTYEAVFGPQSWVFHNSTVAAMSVVKLSLLILGIILLRRRKASTWNVWCFFTSLVYLFTPTSSDFKLGYLLSVVCLLLRGSTSTVSQALSGGVLVLAMAPKPWLHLGWYPWVTATQWLTPLLVGFVLLLCFTPQHFISHSASEDDAHDATAN
jgi:hypothetical protein